MQVLRAFKWHINYQFEIACRLSAQDAVLMDFCPSQWPKTGRRHWTRADLRRYAAYHDRRPVWKRTSERITTRLATGFRQLNSLRFSVIAERSQAAVQYCNQHPHLAPIASVILELTTAHKEWLDWMRDEQPSEIEATRQELWRKFEGMLEVLEAMTPPRVVPAEISIVDLASALGVSVKTVERACDSGLYGKRYIPAGKRRGNVTKTAELPAEVLAVIADK